MTSYVYIDVPHDFELNWNLIPNPKMTFAADEVMTVVNGYTTEFIRNCGAGLSEGDVYRVSFKQTEDETFFLLKTPFKIVNKQVVDDYLNKEELKRTLHRETYSRNPRS